MNMQQKYPDLFRACSAEVSELAMSRLERKYKWGFKRKTRHRGTIGQLIYAYLNDLMSRGSRTISADVEAAEIEMFKYAVKQGWPNKLEDLAMMNGHRKIMNEQARQQREAERDRRGEMITKRREQIARMEKKIALLTTRVKKSYRSLNALIRAQDKADEASKARTQEEQTEATRVVGQEGAHDC